MLPLLAGVLLLGSCVNDDTLEGTGQYRVEPDIPVTLPLKVMLSGNKIATRAAQSDEAERTINNIYVIAFKPEKNQDGTENGNAADDQWVVDNAKNFEVGEAITYDNEHTLEGGFPMTTGIRKIYAIGNPQSGSGSLSEEDLAKIKTLADLKNLGSALRDKQSIERMDFKMTGQVLKTSETGDKELVTVRAASGGSGEIVEAYELELKRVDARITFKIKGTGGYEFTPEYYRVMNIPGGTYVLPREKGSATENTWDFQTGGYAEGFRTSDFSTDNEGASLFEFYLCENRQNPKKQITEEALLDVTREDKYTLYSLRSKQEKSTPDENGNVENGDFVYSNAHSTYVILGGTVTGEKDGEKVYAKVSYKIFLGDTGNKSTSDWQNDVSLVNNYSIERNTHYTYNVTIAGVDKIIVEAESNNPDEEPDPGAEGDVILTKGDYVTLDSHYSRYVMTLKKSEIMDGLSWSITTPFQCGLQVFDTDLPIVDDAYLSTDNTKAEAKFGLPQNTLSLNDYKWVKFAINKECITVNGDEFPIGQVIKFPGEQAYDGGSPLLPAPIAGGKYQETAYYRQVRLYDVNQLLNFLHYKVHEDSSSDDIFEKNDAGEDIVYITVFVDEYIYIYDPTRYFYRRPTGVDTDDNINDGVIDLSLWKKTVNTENRLLNICVEGSKYSPDGQSSVSRSVYTISQNPVYTFYNPNGISGDFNTAWGVEASVETKFLPIVPDGVDNDTFTSKFDNEINTPDNGRSNTLNILSSERELRWDEVINTDITSIDDILLDDYKSIWYACLLRNRDLNGDDIVQASEILWYLASIDQLTDMFVGEAGIPTAKLYQAEVNNDRSAGTLVEGETRVHIASSSYYTGEQWGGEPLDSPRNPYVIWGEEGVSKGSAYYSSIAAIRDGLFSYRCVRNLGISLDNREAMPDDYVTKGTSSYTAEDGTTYQELTIDVSRMVDNCIRPSTGDNAVLPNHTEREANNRPPLTLAILSDTEGATTNWIYPQSNGSPSSIDWTRIENEISNRVCPMGYRIPNLREIALMYTTYPELMNSITGSSYYVTKTGYGYGAEGEGFGYLTTKGNLVKYNVGGVVRCVRDATDNPGGN